MVAAFRNSDLDLNLEYFASAISHPRIADYWPEFGQKGKGETTVADLMRHEVREALAALSFKDMIMLCPDRQCDH